MQKVAAQLRFIEPMECKEVRDATRLPNGRDWQFEVKLDGYRCIAVKQSNDVQLYSRRGKPLAQFPNLFEALLEIPIKQFILDGEVVALDADGYSNFNALQRWGRSPIDVHLFAFDLLHLDGEDLRNRPLSERQQVLWSTFGAEGFIHLPRPVNASLGPLLRKLREFRFEGVIAKRRDSVYEPGKASGAWVKMKLKPSDEFVVGGYIPNGNAVEELVVGKPSGKELIYASSVGDGFVPATRRSTFEALGGSEVSKCPFVNLPESKGPHRMDAEKMKKVRWVKPKLVAEIAFNEWTPDFHLRHSEFKCLRLDKTAKKITPHPSSA